MNVPVLSTRVLQFLNERIDSIPHLEALLLLWQEPAHNWSTEEIGARIYVKTDHARAILQSLQRSQLVTSNEDSTAYRYDPTWDATAQLMSEVAAAYSRHLIQVATFIHSKGSSAVREFARAFEIKKDR